MKTKNIKFLLLIAFITPFLAGCPKAKKPIAPQPDTELQSSIDVSFANFVITDIETMCSFVRGNDLAPDFYIAQPNADQIRQLVVTGQPTDANVVVSFNSTPSLDGRLRDGSVFLSYDNPNPNASYYHRFEFRGEVTMSAYKVDGWLIKTVGGTPFKIYNNLSSPVFNPSQTKLSWTIEGSFEFTHPTDPSRNMVWTGKLTKTLTNTANSDVYNPSRLVAIDWTKAVVEYEGEATGVTSGNVPFKMVINKARPLTRDFTCYPDVIGGISSLQPFKTWKEEFHPFRKGIVSFTSGDKYPREIYYGNEGDTEMQTQCDNSGEVLIKGNSYKVDFMK